MDINSLVGLTLQNCTFSKGSYSFEFSGMKEEEYYQFFVSTSYYLSFSGNEKEDVCKDVSKYLWDFLELSLEQTTIDPEASEIIFKFSNGKQFWIWGEHPIEDNLLIVKEPRKDTWFPVL